MRRRFVLRGLEGVPFFQAGIGVGDVNTCVCRSWIILVSVMVDVIGLPFYKAGASLKLFNCCGDHVLRVICSIAV